MSEDLSPTKLTDAERERLIKDLSYSGETLAGVCERFGIDETQAVAAVSDEAALKEIVESRRAASLLEFWSVVPAMLADFVRRGKPAREAMTAARLWADILGQKADGKGGDSAHNVNVNLLFDAAVDRMEKVRAESDVPELLEAVAEDA